MLLVQKNARGVNMKWMQLERGKEVTWMGESSDRRRTENETDNIAKGHNLLFISFFLGGWISFNIASYPQNHLGQTNFSSMFFNNLYKYHIQKIVSSLDHIQE